MMDLKPCPFCGNPDPDPKGGFEWVRCSVCTATADRTETWNARPREYALQAEVERLRAALTWIGDHMPATQETSLAHEMADIARAALKGAPHE